MPPKKKLADKQPADSADPEPAVVAKESNRNRRKKASRIEPPAAAPAADVDRAADPGTDPASDPAASAADPAAAAADPAAARTVAKKVQGVLGSTSGKQKPSKVISTKQSQRLSQKQPQKQSQKQLKKQPKKQPKKSKEDVDEEKEECREEPPAKPNDTDDSSDDGDSPARKLEPSAVAAAEAAAEAVQRASITQTQIVPSVIRELSAEEELQALLKGGVVGSMGSGGSGSSQRPARMVMLCFSARWCRPCHVFAPKLEVLARRYHRVTFVKLNVDKLPDIADMYKVRAVPTFMLFRSGTQVGSVTSASQAKLEELLITNGAMPLSDEEFTLLMQQLQASTTQPMPATRASIMMAAGKKLAKDS